MPKAARGEAVARWDRIPASAGLLDECEEAFASLEKEANASLDEFVSAVEGAQGFYPSLEKVERQAESAQKSLGAQNDLELNEVAVLAEKLEGELLSAERVAAGAALAERQEEWAEDFEAVRSSLDRMGLQLKRLRSHQGFEAIEARSALLSFRREARACAERLRSLEALRASKRHPAYARLSAARKKVMLLKKSVAKTMEQLARARLRRGIAEAKAEISLFMKNSAGGRVFVDHKHLTLIAGTHKLRIPMTQQVRFALEELVPVKGQLAKALKGSAVLSGSFSHDSGGMLLRLGERFMAGDAIIYREKAFRL